MMLFCCRLQAFEQVSLNPLRLHKNLDFDLKWRHQHWNTRVCLFSAWVLESEPEQLYPVKVFQCRVSYCNLNGFECFLSSTQKMPRWMSSASHKCRSDVEPVLYTVAYFLKTLSSNHCCGFYCISDNNFCDDLIHSLCDPGTDLCCHFLIWIIAHWKMHYHLSISIVIQSLNNSPW